MATFPLETIERLEELHDLVSEYYERYMQDEAEDLDICIDRRQHILAGAIRDLLNEIHEDAAAEEARAAMLAGTKGA